MTNAGRRLAHYAILLFTILSTVSSLALSEYRVDRGDRLFSVSERLLGSCRLFGHLLEFNRDLSLERPLRVGQIIFYDKNLVNSFYDVEKMRTDFRHTGWREAHLCLQRPVPRAHPLNLSSGDPNVANVDRLGPDDGRSSLQLLPLLETPATRSIVKPWTHRAEIGGSLGTLFKQLDSTSLPREIIAWGSFAWTYHYIFDIEATSGVGLKDQHEVMIGGLLSANIANLNLRARNTRFLAALGADYYVYNADPLRKNYSVNPGLRLQISGNESPLYLDAGVMLRIRDNIDLALSLSLGLLM